MKQTVSNQEPKGTRDWLPEEFLVRQYIFDAWRRVCRRYGFEEYLTPLVESAEIYRAKSGEDVGGKELVTFTDLGGRELCIRPEMTPSVTRMVTKVYAASPKPLKYFSIANFMRNEKPQRGRNREFWQLNCDTFGSDSLEADIEILQLALDLMLEFDPPAGSFVLYLNSRKLLDGIFGVMKIGAEKRTDFFRILDKYGKLDETEFARRLQDLGVNGEGLEKIKRLMGGSGSEVMAELAQSSAEIKSAYGEIEAIINRLTEYGYGEWIEFNPAIIRGFDYYDGLVFEVFDRKPENSRALFGGGRYNGLADIFGGDNFPAVGFAPGDETTKLFLESWDLLEKIKRPEIYYLPLLDESLRSQTSRLARELRGRGHDVLCGLEEQKVGKALEFANKKEIAKVVIFGKDEEDKGLYKVKDMESGEEKTIQL